MPLPKWAEHILLMKRFIGNQKKYKSNNSKSKITTVKPKFINSYTCDGGGRFGSVAAAFFLLIFLSRIFGLTIIGMSGLSGLNNCFRESYAK